MVYEQNVRNLPWFLILNLNSKYENLNLPEEEYVTLSGYIVMTHGSIPEEGEEIELEMGG